MKMLCFVACKGNTWHVEQAVFASQLQIGTELICNVNLTLICTNCVHVHSHIQEYKIKYYAKILL